MSWSTKKLGDICHIYGGDAAPQDKTLFRNGSVPFVRMQDLGRYHVTDDLKKTTDKLTTDAIQRLRLKVWRPGVILIPRSGSVYMNHRAILGIDAVVVSHIAILSDFAKEILPYYLFYYLTTVDMGRYGAKTTGIDSISFSQLGRIKITLPSLKTQKQIVERLDKIAEAQKLNGELIQKADELYRSLLHKELNPVGKNWKVEKLGGICDIYQPKTITSKEILKEGPYKVFGANGVIGYYSKYNHDDSEVLVTCRGATCGTLNMSEPKSWITGNAMVVHPQNNKILLKSFLYYTLEHLNLFKTITGTGQPQITRSSLAPFLILLPSFKIQEQIVAKLSAAQEYKTQLLAQKSKLKELFSSVLSKSFSGNLIK